MSLRLFFLLAAVALCGCAHTMASCTGPTYALNPSYAQPVAQQ